MSCSTPLPPRTDDTDIEDDLSLDDEAHQWLSMMAGVSESVASQAFIGEVVIDPPELPEPVGPAQAGSPVSPRPTLRGSAC